MSTLGTHFSDSFNRPEVKAGQGQPAGQTTSTHGQPAGQEGQGAAQPEEEKTIFQKYVRGS